MATLTQQMKKATWRVTGQPWGDTDNKQDFISRVTLMLALVGASTLAGWALIVISAALEVLRHV